MSGKRTLGQHRINGKVLSSDFSQIFLRYASEKLRLFGYVIGNCSPKIKNMPNKCLVCDRISKILDNTNPYFVAELETGYVVVGDFQYFHGYTLFLSKQHKTELHQLEKDFRIKFLKEMSEVAEAVSIAFQPQKLNYELLGNIDSHLHWHIFPRYGDDPCPDTVTWCVDKSIRNSEEARPSNKKLQEIKEALFNALKTTASNIRQHGISGSEK